jgi:hypothetical protein
VAAMGPMPASGLPRGSRRTLRRRQKNRSGPKCFQAKRSALTARGPRATTVFEPRLVWPRKRKVGVVDGLAQR